MLQLKNIVKDYVVNKELTVHALKGINIDFRANEFVSILGPSGCGKTTLLNIIGGLDHYTSGDMTIDGISTKDYGEKQWNNYRNLRIGFVFQSYNLIPHQSVIENVELALTLSGISKEERRQRAKKALEEVGLATELNKRPNQLSGGQMQRVALARALVNNPQIVLADEPTGALDSTTGVQVMELLKKVANNHLVIMVTHNAELAEQYSTRIIRLKDGEVVSDSNPYSAPAQQDTATTSDALPHTATQDDHSQTVKQQSDAKVKKDKKQDKKKKTKVKMSWLTAIALSFRNLMTKKGRTFMTSFAGSIGIIGVALVLALSNGFNMYIANLQTETLSGYPVQVSPISTDLDAMYEQMINGNKDELPKFPEGDNNVHVYDSTAVLGNAMHYNHITQEYIDYINDYYQKDLEKPEHQRTLNSISYSYQKSLNIFGYDNGKYTSVLPADESDDPMSGIMQSFMGSTSVFQEALDNKDYLLSQYDVLYGSYPQSSDELAIIVDSRNRISTQTLQALGIDYTSTGDDTYQDISFEDMLKKEFILVYNDAYYIKGTNGTGKTTYTELKDKDDAYIQSAMQTISQDDTKCKKLKIVGVLRINPDAPLSLYDTGILYLSSLTQEFMANSMQSEIAQAMTATEGYVYTPDKDGVLTLTTIEMAKLSLAFTTGSKLTDEQTVEYYKQYVGASDIPSSISFYPTDFEGKDELLSYLDAWNDTEQGKDLPIYYTDATAILSASMGQMVNIISYVLVAFASISLVVSSVMIGIITYVSVIERTKEIGVLRSLGASKNNVSNIFNAESLLIGLTAGLIGVLVTYLLCIPINIILINVAGGALTTNLAVLNPLAALSLIAISCLLTLISGSIPSRMAAKLDPVKALRTE